MMVSLQERREIILIYGESNRCARETARRYNERRPGANISHTYVRKLVSKFIETGSVSNKKRVLTNRVLNNVTKMEIIGNFVINPCASIRKVSSITGVSRTSVNRVLKECKFHPYKVQMHQKLRTDDFIKRVDFCETMSNLLIETPSLLKNICFSDESTFFLDGRVNSQNCRYWNDINPHITRNRTTQWPQKINVWAGIYGNKVIGPLFFDQNLTGELYLEMLENAIFPLIVHELENQLDENNEIALDENLLHFQQDGAPAHFKLIVRNWLQHIFGNNMISRGGRYEWPARSPDLSPLDFALWGYLKSVVYKTVPQTLEELRHRIETECRNIPRTFFQNCREEFQNRLYYCMEKNGEIFEQFL